jgi:hypothetical protein
LFLSAFPAVRSAEYPIDKRANVRHLTHDNGFVFQPADAKARTSLLRPAGNGGLFYARMHAPPDAFRPVKAIAQTVPSGLPGI